MSFRNLASNLICIMNFLQETPPIKTVKDFATLFFQWLLNAVCCDVVLGYPPKTTGQNACFLILASC